MPRFIFLAVVVLGALTACERGADASKSTDSAPAEATEAFHAAAITIALRMAPTKGDSVLADHGITADQLELMMFRIAADSALSAEYRRLTER